jgi:hypothetical protein
MEVEQDCRGVEDCHCSHCMAVRLHEQKKFANLFNKIEAYLPYVMASISPHSYQETDPGWIEIHKGRAGSSYQQLEHILKLVKDLKGQ